MKQTLLNNRILHTFCFIIASYSTVFSQSADAGEDKLTCTDGEVTIGGSGDPSWCYSWKPETGLSDPKILNPIAKPGVTTTYTLKVTGPDFSFSSTDAMTVTVEPPEIELKVENNITECMEKRTITYTAEAKKGFYASPDKPIKFTFNYQKADGTAWTHDEWSFDLTQDHTVMSDNVLDGDADHKFQTPIFVEGEQEKCKVKSNTLNIEVYELWIESFAAAGKAWKVVVGENISYKAIASNDCKNWDWDMEDGFPDMWNPTGGNAQSGTMTIPNSDLPRDNNWNYFGDTYGTVGVSCEDGEGNNHQISSTSLTPSQKVKVYFDGTLGTNPGGVGRNWFYYWNRALFGNISNVSYNAAIQYGSTSAAGVVIGDSGNANFATPYNHSALFGYPRPTSDGKALIDLYYSVQTHELQHYVDVPHFGGAPDTDGDFLPDAIDPFPATLNGAGFTEYTGTQAWRGDWEFKARQVEGVVAPATSDWSKGGKQW